MMLKKLVLSLVLCCGLVYSAPKGSQISTVVEGGGYFPVSIRLQSGEVLTVFRGGGSHVDRRGRLDMIMSQDSGKSWSAPWTVIDESEDDRNPALGQLKDGSILLAYSILSGYDDNGHTFKGGRYARVFDGVYLMRSTDKGKTWSKPERSEAVHQFYAGKGAVSPYGKIQQMADGTVVMAVYFDFAGERGHESYIFRSKDNGKTWGEPSLLGKHYNETAITLLPNGDMLAAMRSEVAKDLFVTRSTDQGRTWSTPMQATTALQHPADLIVLQDGRVLLSYSERNAPRGVKAILSRDNGKTWDKANPIVLADDAPNFDCGYPSSVEVSKGRIVTTYYQVDDEKNAPATAKAKVIIWQVPR